LKEDQVNQYVKRNQRDYTLTFKLQVVQEVESGQIGVTGAKFKYGIQGDSLKINWFKNVGDFRIYFKKTKKSYFIYLYC
jgi:transposase-like protein